MTAAARRLRAHAQHREPRQAARVSIVIVLIAVLAGWWWWKRQRTEDHPATSTVTQALPGPAATAATQRGASIEPAKLTITVTDDRGPLAGATVRLAPQDGEIVVIKTGGDGVAHADHLEPGAWTIGASAADHVPAALPTKQLAAGADDRLAIKLAAGGRALSGDGAEVRLVCTRGAPKALPPRSGRDDRSRASLPQEPLIAS